MPKEALSHKECLVKVCAICTNLNGTKPKCNISQIEADYIRKEIFSGYRKDSPSFLQGICVACQSLMRRKKKVSEKDGDEGSSCSERSSQFLLPSDYLCQLPIETRQRSLTGDPCSCRWCTLARLNGPQFKLWKADMEKNKKEQGTNIQRMCNQCGIGIPISQKKHSCSTSDKKTVENMLANIPSHLKGKLAHALVKEMQLEH